MSERTVHIVSRPESRLRTLFARGLAGLGVVVLTYDFGEVFPRCAGQIVADVPRGDQEALALTWALRARHDEAQLVALIHVDEIAAARGLARAAGTLILVKPVAKTDLMLVMRSLGVLHAQASHRTGARWRPAPSPVPLHA